MDEIHKTALEAIASYEMIDIVARVFASGYCVSQEGIDATEFVEANPEYFADAAGEAIDVVAGFMKEHYEKAMEDLATELLDTFEKKNRSRGWRKFF